MKKYIFTVLLALSSFNLFAQNPNVGTVGAQFLQIGVGARAIGMGGAYVGVTNDVDALYWNPAGITRVKNHALKVSHLPWFDTIVRNFVGYVYNYGTRGAFGISVNYLSMDDMEVTTEMQPEGTGEFFGASDLSLGLTFGFNLTDRFSVGLTGKYIREKIWNETANGFAFDVGTQYRIDFKNLVIAMCMSNFGGDVRMHGRDLDVFYDTDENLPSNRETPAKLETEAYPLPLNFQVGIAMELVSTPMYKVLAAVDAVHPNDNNERLNFGIEVGYRSMLYLRGGYRYNYDDEGLTFGLGCVMPFSNYKAKFDYSYSTFDLFTNIQRFSIGFEF
jgi:hypothetical protein